jgi:hypothetical protein
MKNTLLIIPKLAIASYFTMIDPVPMPVENYGESVDRQLITGARTMTGKV